VAGSRIRVGVELECGRTAGARTQTSDQRNQKDHPADDDRQRQPDLGAVDATSEAEEKPVAAP
jgi:hypothetical protein